MKVKFAGRIASFLVAAVLFAPIAYAVLGQAAQIVA
jgi:hypothetical protein